MKEVNDKQKINEKVTKCKMRHNSKSSESSDTDTDAIVLLEKPLSNVKLTSRGSKKSTESSETQSEIVSLPSG